MIYDVIIENSFDIGRKIVMKKVFKVILILIIFALLAIDFWGLWKYKINGKKYELASSEDDAGASEDAGDSTPDDGIEYVQLTSKTMTSGEKLFIKNIKQTEDGKYNIKGIVFKPYEISKSDYDLLRSGKSVEILGITYTKNQIKSNNLILKSADKNAKSYLIKYDTTSKKYILKDSKTDSEIYESTDKYVEFDVEKGTEFSVQKSGKTVKSKIEAVVTSHQDLEEPKENTSELNVCTVTFDKNEKCRKILEICK